jgi:hypothetical protein
MAAAADTTFTEYARDSLPLATGWDVSHFGSFSSDCGWVFPV